MPVPLNILAGMMLGDSCVVMGRNSVNAYMKLQHGLPQKEYLLHKVSILQEITKVNLRETTDNGHGYSTVVAETRTHPIYTRLYDQWYQSAKKTVTLDAIKRLDEIGLAYWFMDDGSLTTHYETKADGNRVVHGREFLFHTQSFTEDENYLLRDFIEHRFNVKMRVSKHKKIYWVLGCGTIEGRKLVEIISPYVLPMFNYKLNLKRD